MWFRPTKKPPHFFQTMGFMEHLVLTDMVHILKGVRIAAMFQKVVKHRCVVFPKPRAKRSFVLLVFPYGFIEVVRATHPARHTCQSRLTHSGACLFICALICNMHRIGDKNSSMCLCTWCKWYRSISAYVYGSFCFGRRTYGSAALRHWIKHQMIFSFPCSYSSSCLFCFVLFLLRWPCESCCILSRVSC